MMKRALSENRLKKCIKLYKDRLLRKEEINEINCLQFWDKRDLILKTDIYKTLETSKKKLRLDLVKIEKMRNYIAHSQEESIHGDQLITMSQKIDELLLKLI